MLTALSESRRAAKNLSFLLTAFVFSTTAISSLETIERFFTPLRYVQNDTYADAQYHSDRARLGARYAPLKMARDEESPLAFAGCIALPVPR